MHVIGNACSPTDVINDGLRSSVALLAHCTKIALRGCFMVKTTTGTEIDFGPAGKSSTSNKSFAGLAGLLVGLRLAKLVTQCRY
jgi:hypothetical protein